MNDIYFITGIDTDIGKTIASSVFVEALEADYWKPIQCGDLEYSDTMKVQDLVTKKNTRFHPEHLRLKTPASPHLAAEIENIKIDFDKIELPKTSNKLVIEGAGGILVPLNEKDFIIDLAKKFKAKVILVTKNYLGSLNHTLLSLNYLKINQIDIKGMIFNGSPNHKLENFLCERTGVPKITNIFQEAKLNKEIIRNYAINLKGEFQHEANL